MRTPIREQITSVVSLALHEGRQAGLAGILKTIAEAMNADGCILWQLASGTNPGKEPHNTYLLVIAEWFSNGGAASNSPRYMPTRYSLTGRAVVDKVSINVSNIDEDPLASDPFLAESRIRSMCSVPVDLIGEAGGALNLYRTTSEPFSFDEISLLEQLAQLIPEIYQSVTDAASLKLIRTTNNLLQNATWLDRFVSRNAVNDVIRNLCGLLADTFQCVEVSIFLEDPQAPTRCELIGTTWPTQVTQTVYAASNEGLVGWVLAHAQPIRIFDLSNFQRDRPLIINQYPGLSWTDSPDIAETARQLLDFETGEELPPLSFMAAPVMKGEKVLGVIRCSLVKRRPFYFTEIALNLLALVASQLASYWSSWLMRRELEEEIYSWRRFVESVGNLNSFVRAELTHETPDEGRIFAEALRLTQEVIAGAEIMDVRLLDKGKNELYFAQTFGKAWSEGNKIDIQKRLQKRYPLSGDEPKSAGARVFRTGKLTVIGDVDQDPFYSATFPNTKEMLIAPIKIADEKFGVLDIRRIGEQQLPKHARLIAELLGQQLGLYSYLADTIGTLRKTEAELKSKVEELKLRTEQELRILEDLSHQFKTPITQAVHLVQEVLKTHQADELDHRLRIIRGLCSKAKRVSYGTSLFSALARNQSICLSTTPLTYEDLRRLLFEAAHDHQLIYSRLAVRFHVDLEGVINRKGRMSGTTGLDVDRGLLEQVVNVLLDNAGKYSYRQTSIAIKGGFTSGGGFYLSFENRGIPIRADEVDRCIERGWQSEKAKPVSSTGSGIGLWIAHHIMLAHNGRLEINPTTQDHRTRIRLIFPSTRVK